MDTNYLENNYLTLVGKVTGEKRFSHEIYGESFYVFNLSIHFTIFFLRVLKKDVNFILKIAFDYGT